MATKSELAEVDAKIDTLTVDSSASNRRSKAQRSETRGCDIEKYVAEAGPYLEAFRTALIERGRVA